MTQLPSDYLTTHIDLCEPYERSYTEGSVSSTEDDIDPLLADGLFSISLSKPQKREYRKKRASLSATPTHALLEPD